MAKNTDSTQHTIQSIINRVYDEDNNFLYVSADGSVASGDADSGNPQKIGGVYNASAPTLTDGDRGDLQMDVNGNTKITLATALSAALDSITNYPVGCNMTTVDLATNADVVVTAAPAYLLGIYVNTVMSAHAANIQDNSTVKLILPASTAAGTKIDCHTSIFSTNITVNCDDAATGELVIFWRAI